MTACDAENLRQIKQRGNAALEALMLLIFLIIPLWGLSFTMGYFGLRVQQTQEALTLSTYRYVIEREAGASNPGANAQSTVAGEVFPNETDPLTVNVANEAATAATQAEIDADTTSTLGDLMGGLSGRSSISVTVTRSDPLGQFADGNLQRGIVVGGSALTYCEVENAPMNPFEAADVGAGVITLIADLAGLGDYVLAPFGGLPSGDSKCK